MDRLTAVLFIFAARWMTPLWNMANSPVSTPTPGPEAAEILPEQVMDDDTYFLAASEPQEDYFYWETERLAPFDTHHGQSI